LIGYNDRYVDILTPRDLRFVILSQSILIGFRSVRRHRRTSERLLDDSPLFTSGARTWNAFALCHLLACHLVQRRCYIVGVRQTLWGGRSDQIAVWVTAFPMRHGADPIHVGRGAERFGWAKRFRTAEKTDRKRWRPPVDRNPCITRSCFAGVGENSPPDCSDPCAIGVRHLA
jgi:hypothetical protein